MRRTLALALALLAGCAPRPATQEREGHPAAVATQEASIFDLAFPFTDADGHPRTLAEFRGRPFVASMVYTNCTSVCPRITADLLALERALPPEERSRTRFVLFSLDPGRDTPAALTRFAEEHALDRSRWTLLASGEDDLRTLAAVLGVRYRPDEGGEIAHSAVILVVDREGVIRHRQTGLAGDTGPLLAALRAAGGSAD